MRGFLLSRSQTVKFYIVSDEYINHLREADTAVYENKGTRPYLGVIFEVNNVEYLAPLTSHKPKHDNIPDNSPLIFKIKELGNESNKLGMVQINNMVPVLESERELLDVSRFDLKYQNLLNLQQQYLRKHKEDLHKKASKLHSIVSKGHAKGLIKMSCNFPALEAAMNLYVPQTAPATADKLDQLRKMFEKD